MRLEEYGIVYYRCGLGDPPPARYRRYDCRRHHIITENKAEGDTGLVWCSSPDDFITLCEKWTTKHWKFYPIGRIGPEIFATRNKPERTQHMTITVRHREKKPKQMSVLSLGKGVTFTGTIRYNYRDTPHSDTGLFLVTVKNAKPSDEKLVLMVLDSDLKCPQPYVIDAGFSSIQIENFKDVDLAIAVIEK